ncbi:MAG: sensor histidine kinase N-terminal domain-containing protein [Gammaproteobacteria bacterium]|nr:sensor histidine kinase N-terminal domain-containing protein [Gammaproteobacteria bacterium]
MPAKSQSLRRKLLVWLLLPLLILFFLRAGYNYYYGNALSNRVYDRMLITLASSLSQQLAYAATSHELILPRAAYQILMSDEYDEIYFAIRDTQGHIIEGENRMPPVPANLAEQQQSFSTGRIYDREVRIINLRHTLEHDTYVIQVAETLTKRSLLSREFQSGVILPQMLIIVLATLIVWFGIGKSLVPLKRLQKAVSERSHLDLSPVSGEEIPAEVQPLIHAINDLMARLSKVLDVQNRFIADAAHQLRTPLAGLKAQIDLALREHDPTITLQAIQNLRASTDRMTRLVNQLLALARNEPMAERAFRKLPLDLGLLASQITMEWVPRALEKYIDIGFEAPNTPITLQGDAARLKDLLDNLIDNAVRYTPHHGQVTVSVFNNDRAHLAVTDNGPGIPLDQRERVFERFYSVLGHGAEGSGLGLAIVREIARMHGGEARIESGPTGIGTRVSGVF